METEKGNEDKLRTSFLLESDFKSLLSPFENINKLKR
jgi:hypothetical protein